MMKLYLGCPIWANKDWVGSFFPEGTKSKDFLREYARRLTAVEGNTTFYAVPSPKTVQEWISEMPETFRFCPKLPRSISHTGKLGEHQDEALRLPPRYPPGGFDDLQAFLDAWPSAVPLAVEVRHLGWFDSPHNERLNELLAGRGMARVVID